MKVNINKSKLDNIIYQYIDDLFHNNELGQLNYTYFNDLGDERDWQINFYFGDYGDDNTAFVWETEEIYNHYGISGGEDCPHVIIEGNIENKLNAMFNDLWKPIFKIWFKYNYDLELKTIV